MSAIGLLLAAIHIAAPAQNVADTTLVEIQDTISADSLEAMMTEAELAAGSKAKAMKKRNGITDDDTLSAVKTKRDWATWSPCPQRAL